MFIAGAGFRQAGAKCAAKGCGFAVNVVVDLWIAQRLSVELWHDRLKV